MTNLGDYSLLNLDANCIDEDALTNELFHFYDFKVDKVKVYKMEKEIISKIKASNISKSKKDRLINEIYKFTKEWKFVYVLSLLKFGIDKILHITNKFLTRIEYDYDLFSDVEVTNIVPSEYPNFDSAAFTAAKYDGKELTRVAMLDLNKKHILFKRKQIIDNG